MMSIRTRVTMAGDPSAGRWARQEAGRRGGQAPMASRTSSSGATMPVTKGPNSA